MAAAREHADSLKGKHSYYAPYMLDVVKRGVQTAGGRLPTCPVELVMFLALDCLLSALAPIGAPLRSPLLTCTYASPVSYCMLSVQTARVGLLPRIGIPRSEPSSVC